MLCPAPAFALESSRDPRLALADRGFYKDYDHSVQALRDVPCKRWREYDSADSLRFYALRLREAGMVKSASQKLIAQGTDWRLLDQLKKELKA